MCTVVESYGEVCSKTCDDELSISACYRFVYRLDVEGMIPEERNAVMGVQLRQTINSGSGLKARSVSGIQVSITCCKHRGRTRAERWLMFGDTVSLS